MDEDERQPPETTQAEIDEAGPTTARRDRSTGLWLKVVLFASGILVGVLAVGLLDVTTPDFAAGPGAGGAASGRAQPQPGPTVAPGAEARVNAACLGVLNEAQDVYAVLGDLGQAVDDVDLTALDDIVRRLQPVEPRLGQDLVDCRVDTSVGAGGAATAPGAPLTTPPALGTPSPSATG